MSPADRRRGVALLSVLLAAILGACSSGSAPSPAASVPVVAAPSGSDAAASPTPSPTPAFPVTVTDDEGTSVELAAEPKKIVSLTPATTEILFALGAGDRVVATDDGSDHPEQAVALPMSPRSRASMSRRSSRFRRTSWWPAVSDSRRPNRSPSCGT